MADESIYTPGQFPDKFGYLNNPRWLPENGQPFMNRRAGDEGGYEHERHIPCGHWHKRGVIQNETIVDSWWQQAVDVYQDTVAFAALSRTSSGGKTSLTCRSIQIHHGSFTMKHFRLREQSLLISARCPVRISAQ